MSSTGLTVLLLVTLLLQSPYGSTGKDCDHLLDIVAVVDGSESVEDADFAILKTSLVSLVNQLRLGDNDQRFGAIVYSSKVTATVPISSDRVTLDSKIAAFSHPRSGTATYLGIKALADMMASQGRTDVPKVGIVITDGLSKNTGATLEAAEEAKDAGIHLLAVGIGEEVDKTELYGIASDVDSVMELMTFDELQNNIMSLVQKVCVVNGEWSPWSSGEEDTCSVSCGGGTTTVTRVRSCNSPPPSNGGKDCEGSPQMVYPKICNTDECPVDGGWSDWVLSVADCTASCGGGTQLLTETRSCTNPSPSNDGKPCSGLASKERSEACSLEPCPDCTHLQDVIAVVDGSESIKDPDFVKLKDAAVEMADWLNLKDDGQRYGALVYSDEVEEQAPLTSDIEQIKTQIRAFKHPKDGTATALGISEMTAIMKRTGRPGVPKVAVVITDGRSVDTDATLAAAEEARDFGINMFAVGVGDKVKTSELMDIASYPENVKEFPNFDELRSNIAKLVLKVCIVHGGWGRWSSVRKGDCSVTCGGGTRVKTRTRLCNNPVPSSGGRDCEGSGTDTSYEACGTKECQENPCTDCRYDNGVGYAAHLSDCTKFYQCMEDGRYFIKPCPPSTIWDQTDLTCVRGSCVNAGPPVQSDPQVTSGVSQATSGSCDGTTRAVDGDTSSYEENIAVLGWTKRPCPPGTVYISSTCKCDHPVSSGGPPEACNLGGTMRAVVGKDNIYQENIPGWGWMERPCAPGTVFDGTRCLCDHPSTIVAQPAQQHPAPTQQPAPTPAVQPQPKECREELDLNFDDDLLDHSGYNVAVENEGVVKTINGHAFFDDNDFLRINRFSNVDFGEHLSITLNVRRDGGTDKPQAILSNSDCDEVASFYISRTASHISFAVRNDKKELHTLFLSIPPPSIGPYSTWLSIGLSVSENRMVAFVSGTTGEKLFAGNIYKTHCALQIGQASGYQHFSGYLDDVKVFMCTPAFHWL